MDLATSTPRLLYCRRCMLRCPDPPIEETYFTIYYCLSPNTTRNSQKNSLCEAGRHPRQASLLTIPYVHMCSHCNLQAMGCRSSYPPPSEDAMGYEKQARSVHNVQFIERLYQQVKFSGIGR